MEENTTKEPPFIEWEAINNYLFNFPKIKNFIKNNKTLILFIPTILGGIWQFLELYSIDTIYIRFFSITQLISDGLVILFVTLPLLLFYYLLLYIGANYNKVFRKNAFNFNRYIFVLIFLFSLLIVVGTMISVFMEYVVISESIMEISNAIGISLMLAFYLGVFNLSSNKIRSGFLDKKKRIKILMNFDLFIFMIKSFTMFFLFIVLLTLIKLISSNYSFPEDSLNINNVYSLLETDYNLESKKCKIAYMNDTYTFIEYSYPKEKDEMTTASDTIAKKIIIYKTDELFNTNRKIENINKEKLIEEPLKLNDSINFAN